MTEPTEDTVRAEVRAWLEANWGSRPRPRAWREKLIDAGARAGVAKAWAGATCRRRSRPWSTRRSAASGR